MLGFVVLSAILVTAFSTGVLSEGMGAGIPTKEEQLKILKSIEELFNEVEILVTEEGAETDVAVIKDTHSTVDSGLEYLAIMEDYALLKLSCSTPSGDCAKVKEEIENAAREGEKSLHYCMKDATASVHNNTQVVTTATDEAMNRGKLLMELLTKCSKKPGLQQISCYKKVVTSDVFPLKSIILDTMQIHKSGHMEFIAIRSKVAECVNEALKICHDKLSEILSNADGMCE